MAATAAPAPCVTPHRHDNLTCCGRGHGPLLQATDFFGKVEPVWRRVGDFMSFMQVD